MQLGNDIAQAGTSSWGTAVGRAQLWVQEQWELLVCSEGRDRAWDVVKGEVQNEVQKCLTGGNQKVDGANRWVEHKVTVK